jgi:chromatin segregation and condensation protein Rec8/ScpA/Scc1 (kleisin family)
MIRVLSQERAATLSALIDEQERSLAEYNKRSTEYEKIVRERRNVVNSVRERIEEATQKVRRREALGELAARYLELANGDKFMAARFLRKAEPDVDEYLTDLPRDRDNVTEEYASVEEG